VNPYFTIKENKASEVHNHFSRCLIKSSLNESTHLGILCDKKQIQRLSSWWFRISSPARPGRGYLPLKPPPSAHLCRVPIQPDAFSQAPAQWYQAAGLENFVFINN